MKTIKPSSFSGFSKIQDVKTYDSYFGMICDSEDIRNSLRVYGSKFSSDSEKLGPYSVKPNENFEKIVDYSMELLKRNGSFYLCLNYENFQTPYFAPKNNRKNYIYIECSPVDKDYDKRLILKIREPEKIVGSEESSKVYQDLASFLKKPLAIDHSNIVAELSVVDNDWYNINITETLKNLPITGFDLENIIDSWDMNKSYNSAPLMKFSHEGNTYDVSVFFNVVMHDQNMNLHPLFGAKNGVISGPAWKDTKIGKVKENPALKIATRIPYFPRFVADSEKNFNLKRANEVLASYLK